MYISIARRRAVVGAIVAFGVAVGVSPEARANPEAYAQYGRSGGMGGTGQAFVDGAAAIYHNPSNLDGVESFGAELSASAFLVDTSAPFASPTGEINQRSTGTSLVPFILGSAALRVHERVVVGIGGHIRYGTGGEFQELPELGGNDLLLSLAVAEVSVPVSVRILDNLRAGVALRWGLAFQTLQQPGAMPTGQLAMVDQNMQAFNPVPGISVGLSYDIVPGFSVGATYRSQIDLELEGTTDMNPMSGDTPALSMDTNAEINIPHAVAVGIAYRFFENRVLLAADFSVRFFESMERLTVRVDDTDEVISDQALNWRNSFGGHFGAEVSLSELLSLRGGYMVFNSATTDGAAGALFPPPGMIHSLSAGSSLHIDDFRLDLSGIFNFVGSEVDTTENGPPGEYTGTSGSVLLSLGYAI